MGYPPSQCGYCVRSIATHYFFTSSNIIFDENIPYNSLHTLSTVSNVYSTLPFLEECPSVIPTAPELPLNPSNLDADSDHLELLDTSPSPPPAVPIMPPPGPHWGPLATPHPVQMRSQESSGARKLMEKRRLFEQKIEAERDHLVRVREVEARQGGESMSGLGRKEGEGDESKGASEDDKENPFIGGGFENTASLAMAVSLDAEDYP